jgi:hypothetical protein
MRSKARSRRGGRCRSRRADVPGWDEAEATLSERTLAEIRASMGRFDRLPAVARAVERAFDGEVTAWRALPAPP